MRKIDFAGVIAGQEERDAVNRVMDGTWLGHGKEADAFEKEFAAYVGTKYAILVNSGSSANLLAMAALKERRPGVIVCGGGFPATLNPMIHLGYQPFIVDVDRRTHNIDLDQVEQAAKDNSDIGTIYFAHTLGLPVDMDRVMDIARKYNLRVVEDSCEALGSEWDGRKVGSIGDVGTFSFYPSHQMTALGGGGMLVTNSHAIAMHAKSMREWGKRQVEPGFEGDYKTDFTEDVDGIKYARSYTYDTVGYNFKFPEANAAYGREQLKRLDGFNDKRRENYAYARKMMEKYSEYLETPDVLPKADPSYFFYCVTVKENCPVTRDEFVRHFEQNGVRTRPFFAGNILKQPAYYSEKNTRLEVATYLMKNTFVFGVWPGLGKEDFDYIGGLFEELLG